MAQTGMYHGGLVFQGGQDTEIGSFCRIVAATLEDYGHQVERQSVMGPTQARVVTSHYLVRMSLDERRYREPSEAIIPASDLAGKSRHRLEIAICPVAEGCEDRDISELMMVVMLYRMVDICNTETIEWMDPATVLTVDQFLSAFSSVSPHRVRGHHAALDRKGSRFAPVDDTASSLARRCDTIHDQMLAEEDALIDLTEEEMLALAFRADAASDGQSERSREEIAQSDIRRLAIWGMTGMVAFLSAPVAVSMAAVNLARGEDFRLNTQVLSLTGLLVVLHGSGTLASIVNALPV